MWNAKTVRSITVDSRVANPLAPHHAQLDSLAKNTDVFYLVVDNKIKRNLVTLLFTPGQLRSAVSIAPETYRHWKKALEPLRRARGHSPCFSSGDLVAVTVVRLLALDMGIRVGTLTSIGEPLFEICNRSPWHVLERVKLIIDLANGSLQLRNEFAEVASDKPIILIPLAPLIEQLREQLLTASGEDEQRSLRFPPVEVAPSVAARGGRP